MSYTDIQKVRIEVGDNEPGLYILADEEIAYLLDKNNNAIIKTSLDAARIILMKISMRSDETVDILSIKNSTAASNYRQALIMYIKDPNLNPIYSSLSMWVGGVSKTEIIANKANVDNKYVQSLNAPTCPPIVDGFSFV